ncbi:DUF2231 domain-containing protein [Cellulosimicrobium cellulans]|uniref:DUF2231 domain-containing protein n=1 Tax=Cellulosimicrobium cellulans TaxID=1710 RepID=UPI00084930A2|nr:DUF2231 domain-containing protein [Cellulosimicrobium cellulans]
MTSGTDTPVLLRAARALEESSALDGLSSAVRGVALAVVPSEGRLRDELHGRTLGHALHSTLTDVPVGLWTSAAVLDVAGGRKSTPAAQRLVGLGLLATVPTVLSGLADYLAVDRKARRVGSVHATLNSGVAAMYGVSWLLRRKGRHGAGAAVGLLAYGVAGASAYLGGHIAQALREPPADVALGGSGSSSEAA